MNALPTNILLTDCLGNLSPFSALMPIRERHPLASTDRRYEWAKVIIGWYISSDSQLGRDYKWDGESVEAAISALDSTGFAVAEDASEINGAYRITHLLTAKVAQEAEAKDCAKWAGATPCYLRYGDLPQGCCSRNHADGVAEAGVSVYRGLELASGEVRVAPSTNQELCGEMFLRDRALYVVTGSEVGVGSDGEPLLQNARIMRKVETNA